MPGKSAFELLDALGTDGGVRTLLVLASNVAVSAPDARRVISRLGDLDFLAVSDFFLSETAELADVVLPSAMWAEEEGTMTNLEGRVIRRRRALDPPVGVPDDLQLLATLAERLGAGRHFSGDPETVFDELRRASAGGVADYAGISYRRIDDEQGVFWPCPTPRHPGTPRLFTERFATPDGRARFLRVEHVDAHERPDADYPYVLTTGRVLAQYQSGTQTRRTRSLQLVTPSPRAELHPDLARRLGIGGDDVVELTTRRGRARFHALVTDTIRPDVVFVPFHWGGGSSANALTDADALDPTSKMAAFKVCAVAVARAGGPEELIAPPAPATQPQPRDHTPSATPEPRHPTRKRSTRVKSSPRFLQGVFPITGEGLSKPGPVDAALRYTVPQGSPPRRCTSGAATRRPSWSTSCSSATASRCAGSRSARRATSTCRCGWSRTSSAAPSSSCTPPPPRASPASSWSTSGWWRYDRRSGWSPRRHDVPAHRRRSRHPPPAGGGRQRDGRCAAGRGGARARRRGTVPDHRLRRRAARQLQPDHALAGAGGEAHEDDIVLNSHDWYADNDVDLRAGVRIERIDTAAKQVHAADGTTTPTTTWCWPPAATRSSRR
ncbi:molybdopterin oxidoreductase family protein [Blastococcus brunescens]|uniref:Molybdopterin dinucleotide binding domain-containing protein n=1 Tax=Blastococcus brunescens TaxID=1564165 RepID=A0ABZ1B636_9ACTN|nr:molybdopterin dinucleotide binding domain-containing protein [Blastococcus sp. BMG 8361]WRL66282.1 molybdopterin dinucleotide binding domain-containing protein [Blastococcus sp. BMG 8361]